MGLVAREEQQKDSFNFSDAWNIVSYELLRSKEILSVYNFQQLRAILTEKYNRRLVLDIQT